MLILIARNGALDDLASKQDPLLAGSDVYTDRIITGQELIECVNIEISYM